MIIELEFPEINKTVKQFDSETSKLQPLNLSWKRGKKYSVFLKAYIQGEEIKSQNLFFTGADTCHLECRDRHPSSHSIHPFY